MTLVSLRPQPSAPPPPRSGPNVGHEPGSTAVPLFDDPSQEGYGLLGHAWRSSMPTTLRTGSGFDVVQVTEVHAAPALERIRRLRARRGAVFADDERWHFFVPPKSGFFPEESGTGWPATVSYLHDAWITVPPRGARTGNRGLRWITREPAGHLYTAPIVLREVLEALAPPPPDGKRISSASPTVKESCPWPI